MNGTDDEPDEPIDLTASPISIALDPDDLWDPDDPYAEVHEMDSTEIFEFVVQHAREIESVPTVLVEPCVPAAGWEWLTTKNPRVADPEYRVTPWMWITMVRMANEHGAVE